MRAHLLALLLVVAPTQALAQSAAVVDGVQMPAWRERGGERMPLAPGMELRSGDRIISGAGARVLVKLAEGSVVKLGENASLGFSELRPERDLFRAALEVLQGAFRFTTEVVSKPRKREVNVRVGQVTAGVRGTDFWGRSRGGSEIVCLIEGAIEVDAQGEPPVRMDKPLQFYRRDKGKALPVGMVDPKQLAQWGTETEIEAGKGAARRGGRFSVQAATADTRDAAAAVQRRLAAAGYAAELATRKDGERTLHVVRIGQLPSRAEAQALADRLKGNFGVVDPII